MTTAAPAWHLILVKHSLPTIVPGVPASEWTLSTEGRQRCDALVARLRDYTPTVIATSDEPKAAETARLLAVGLGFTESLTVDHDLREHERGVHDFIADQ